jgi:ribonuclease HII
VGGLIGGEAQHGGLVVGIDEAGRGSIIGEMFVAGFASPQSAAGRLLDLGVRDSKELTPSQRSHLYRELVKLGFIGVVAVPPRDIDNYNLNRLTEKAALRVVEIIARQTGGYDKLGIIIIDKFGEPRLLHSELRRRGFRGIIIVEEKADSRYPHVAAASIIAKHLRDQRIRVLSSLYGVPGSGYPSDPRTMEWVKRVLNRGERPPIIRYSWSSLKPYGFGRKESRSRSLEEWL